MPPAVIDAMAQFRSAIDAQEQAQSLRMAQAWVEISRGLDQEFERLARDVAAAKSKGKGTSFWHLQRMDRYQSLAAQIAAQQRQFAPIAANQIAETQALLGRWGIQHGQQLISLQRPAITGQFDRLPLDAIKNMVGNAGDGTPLGTLLRRSWGDESIQVGNVLVRGTALGWNPVRTARAMRDEVNVTLERAILIGRTEQMRVYREGSRQQYTESRVVEGYRRLAAKSARTCMACLMADGQFYPLSVPFEEHPSGRCSAFPVVFGAPPVVYETGDQWFMRQDEAIQRTMMGPGRYEAWQEGRFALPDLVTVRQNNVWGNSLQVTPLRLLGSRPAGSVPPPTPPLSPAPPVPNTPQPQGIPVSTALTMPTGPAVSELREAMAAIDSVHGDGQLDVIPLNVVRGVNYEAAYLYRGDKAVEFHVRDSARDKRFSLIHEAGHWLDHQQLHTAWGVQSNQAVRVANQRALDAIKATDQYQYWEDLRAGRSAIEYLRPDGSLGSYTPARDFMNYMMENEELWARAYSQYIVVRSQSPGLVQEFNDYRRRVPGFDQWADSDFVPVANAIDEILSVMGWRQ